MENSKIIEYIDQRIAVYTARAGASRVRQVAEPTQSVKYAAMVAMSKASILSLEHIKYFIENGTDHPDLIVPVQSEEKTEEPVVEEKPTPKPRGRKPASKPAVRPGK